MIRTAAVLSTLTLCVLDAAAQTVVNPLVAPRANYSVVAGSDTGAPSARMWGGSATDGTTLFVFGGRTSPNGAAGSVYYNGLYAYDSVANSWATLSAEADPTAPLASFREAMAYDPIGNRVVVYGGRTSATGTILSDCHVFDLGTNTWSQIANPTPGTTGPLELDGAHMAYDAATASLVLFGGSTSTGKSDETWLLIGTTWAKINGLTPGVDSPVALNIHGMASRSSPYNDVVLVGGQDASSVNHTDTWRWDGVTGTWSQIVPINSTVPVTWLSGNEVVYDAVRQVLVINNGPGTNVAPSNTTSGSTGWVSEYDCVTNEWRAFGVSTTSQTASDPVIGNLQRFFSAFVGGKVLIWGGQNTNTIGDADLTKIKEYQAGTLATAATYGTGCGGLGLTAGSDPWGGRDWTVTGTGFGAAGFGATILSLGQASLPLPSPGMPGCDLLLDANLILGTVFSLPTAGSVTFTLSVPFAPAFGGLPLNAQMFSFDAGVLTASNGVAAVLGAN
ncbi:MAG: hypothetical protein KDC48_10915 [Planctomycetes bacterium]|nr:hypothetical protein [Planctomycetota bacterium]